MVACTNNDNYMVENETLDNVEVVDANNKSSDANEDEITEQISDKSSIVFEDFEFYSSESITYSELENVSDKTFTTILNVMESIEFSEGIIQEDLFESISLRKRYLKVLKGEDGYNNCLEKKGYSDLIEYDSKNVEEYSYYYFDIDGDEVPELTVFGDMRYAHIFAYEEETDAVELRDVFKLGKSFILGNSKFGAWHGGTGLTYEFYELGKNEERESQVYFHSEEYYNNITKENDVIYMVGFGEGSEELNAMKLIATDKVEQVYEENATYFWKITSEQYDQITSDFFDSKQISEEKMKGVRYTYEELFGDLEQ